MSIFFKKLLFVFPLFIFFNASIYGMYSSQVHAYDSQEACLTEPVYTVEQCTCFISGVSIFVYRGHSGVTNSLVRGLKKLGIDYTINCSDKKLHEHVVVLAGIDNLHRAIALKKAGRIKTLLVGPSMVGLPTDYNRILAAPEIDAYLVPSDWTAYAAREDVPSLQTCVWYSGIDLPYWSSKSIKQKSLLNNNILVYWKTESLGFCQHVEQVIRLQGYNPVRIVYGHYSHEGYKKLLGSVCGAVFISRTESQGLALAEAWAMNVPTFVWDSCEPRQIVGRLYDPVSPCPYMNNSVGSLWHTDAELATLLHGLSAGENMYAPQVWCAEYMSDQASVHRLLNIIINCACLEE